MQSKNIGWAIEKIQIMDHEQTRVGHYKGSGPTSSTHTWVWLNRVEEQTTDFCFVFLIFRALKSIKLKFLFHQISRGFGTDYEFQSY